MGSAKTDTCKDSNGIHGHSNTSACTSTNNYLQVTMDNMNHMHFHRTLKLCQVLLARLKIIVTLKHLKTAINMPLYFTTFWLPN